MASPPRHPHRSLRRQMYLMLLGFGLLPLLAMAVAGFLAHRAAVETQLRNGLEAMVKNRRITVELFLGETMRQLELIAASQSVEQLSRPEVVAGLLDQLRA
jgi:hypothetical protein